MKFDSKWTALVLVAVLATTGCATKKYVGEQVSASEQQTSQRIEQVEGQVESNQTRLDEQEGNIEEASKTAQEALDRAIAAGKLAEGKFLYEASFTEDQVRFASDKAELDDSSRAALDAFAEKVKGENQNVYLEIQGHTDATGGDDHNYELGLERAETVRRYLNMEQGFPLHRMSVISYGESAPVGDNKTKEGRANNRRVVVVVLQ
ncbi:MAG: OmpA family protein [Acidobacteriota bacterium]|nr:OmpA family protein [Acidobacteriota bacterium]